MDKSNLVTMRQSLLKHFVSLAKCMVLLLPLLMFSCTADEVTSNDDKGEVYASLSKEDQVVWDYFMEYSRCTQVVSTGIVRYEEGKAPVGGADDINARFAFTGKAFTIDGVGEFNPQIGKGIPFDELKLLPLSLFRKGKCSAETDAMFVDAKMDLQMKPTRIKINYTSNGDFESVFVYFEGIQSKTNPAVTYTMDFEIF